MRLSIPLVKKEDFWRSLKQLVKHGKIGYEDRQPKP